MKDNPTDKIYVTGLKWHRVFLEMVIHSEIEGEINFSLQRFQKVTNRENKKVTEEHTSLRLYEEVPIHPDRKEGSDYHFYLNVTCINGRTFLDNGHWKLNAYVKTGGGEEVLTCSVTNEVAYSFDDLSRTFPYGDNRYTYIFSFGTYSDSRQILSFYFNSRFMEQNDSWKKRRYVHEASTAKGKFKRAYMLLVIKLIRAYYQVAEHMSPKKGKNIMFMSETRPYLWGNLKYIDDRIKERGLDKEFNITYSLREAVGKHKSISSWVKLVTNIAKQDYIFVDDYVPIFGFLDLNSRTKLIQVWHAGVGFKSVGYSRFGKTGSPFPVGSCHKKYDYAVTGSKQLVEVYEEVFGIPEEAFLPVGMPRLDGFLDEEKIKSFKEEFYSEHPECKGRKVILFAPTYRGSNKENAYYDYKELDLGRIYDFLGDEYIWAFKMHPFIKKRPEIPEEYSDRIIDLSSYENINDLYYISDIHITDYSSSYFEYSILRRPVLFFTYDRETYELTRGIHRPVKETAPGRVCDTFDELMDALENEDYELEKTLKFADENFGEYDGKASDKIIDKILLGK